MEEAQELVVKFWPKNYIEEISNQKIRPQYKPQLWYACMIRSQDEVTSDSGKRKVGS